METEETQTEEAVYTDFSELLLENFSNLSSEPLPNLPPSDFTGNEDTIAHSEWTMSLGTGNEYQVVEAEMSLEGIFCENIPSKAGKRRNRRSRSRKRTNCPSTHSPKT
jgi:hypothetical protein